jgi:hypothetical protein
VRRFAAVKGSTHKPEVRVESSGLLLSVAAVIVVFAALALFIMLLLFLRIDWTPGRYKIIYHRGPTIDLSTLASMGWLRVEDGSINVKGKKEEFAIPLEEVQSVEMIRLHGLGRMVRIVHGQNTLFVSVVRFCIAGRFAVVNFFKTGALARHLSPPAIP